MCNHTIFSSIRSFHQKKVFENVFEKAHHHNHHYPINLDFENIESSAHRVINIHWLQITNCLKTQSRFKRRARVKIVIIILIVSRIRNDSFAKSILMAFTLFVFTIFGCSRFLIKSICLIGSFSMTGSPFHPTNYFAMILCKL